MKAINIDTLDTKTSGMYNCYYDILCTARKPLEFRRIMSMAHSEVIERGFVWLKAISNIDGANDPEFWYIYSEYMCGLPEETKREYFLEWMKRLDEYRAAACVDEKSEKCVKIGKAENEFNVVLAKYTANGVCSAHAKEFRIDIELIG